MKMGKYLAKYVPNHPRATKEGCVYEHVLVAEESLGRYLKDGEIVHHIDENKYNNSSENLMVFKTNSDHISFHKGLKNIKLDEDVYISLNKIEEYIICPSCNKNKMHHTAKMCLKCANNNRKELLNNIKVDREKIKEEVYYNSFVSVAKKYNVTDNAIKKWLKRHDILYRKEIIKLIPYDEWISEKISENTMNKISEYEKYLKTPKVKKDNRRKIVQLNKDTNEVINIFDSIIDANIMFNKNKNNSNIKEACRIRNSHEALGYLWYYNEDFINFKQVHEC